MSNPLGRHLEWLNQHTEEIIDAERPIIDPHHHLWPGETRYLLEDLWAVSYTHLTLPTIYSV